MADSEPYASKKPASMGGFRSREFFRLQGGSPNADEHLRWLRYKAVRYVASSSGTSSVASELLEVLGLDPSEGVGEAPIANLSGE